MNAAAFLCFENVLCHKLTINLLILLSFFTVKSYNNAKMQLNSYSGRRKYEKYQGIIFYCSNGAYCNRYRLRQFKGKLGK